MVRYFKIIVILAITVILLATLSEARRRPSRKRHPGRRPNRFLPFGRNPRGRVPPGVQESKNVFYYSVPQTTERPRIILGDELNFEDLGVQRPLRQPKHRPSSYRSHSPTSLSALEQAYAYDDDAPVPHPPLPEPPRLASGRYPPTQPQKRPRSRGPGYRRERPWDGNVVLEQNYKPQKHRNNLSVMPYLFSAGKNLAGAYRAAVIQSAKVAKFTGHTASKYFHGMRNLMGVRDLSRSDLREPEPTQQASFTEGTFVLKNELPEASVNEEVVEIDLSSNAADEDSLAKLPKVYLDWGGSFWRFFYNKAGDMPLKGQNRDAKKKN